MFGLIVCKHPFWVHITAFFFFFMGVGWWFSFNLPTPRPLTNQCMCPFSAYIKRVIAHPSFHNINFKQAEKMMETMDQGDVIIRPSSKGENHLTVTWKVSEGIYQHVDVREEGKENAFSLGSTLWINTEVCRNEQCAPCKGTIKMAFIYLGLYNIYCCKHM